MLLSDFDYILPEELIAQDPVSQRDQSRLLVLHRKTGKIEHRRFYNIIEYLEPGDLMVFNDTRVVATRLHGHKDTGGQVEALLMRKIGPGLWEAMIKPGRRVHVGARISFEDALSATVVDRTVEGGRVLRFDCEGDCDDIIARIGEVPLPPYICKRLEDKDRYQTVYAQADGSAAAPTAGLHFTPKLLDKIREKGVDLNFVTLHVGIATFRPVRTENILEHEMHAESVVITEESSRIINDASGRVISVGTTTARALESAAAEKGKVAPMCGETRLFVTPGYEFKAVEALVTNFHIPKSTLLMLVSALSGRELMLRAYEEAIRERYRFLSFGDAMFIV